MSADSYADLLERLFADFEHALPLGEIELVVTGCRRDLRGQVHPAASLELIERLARQRLSELTPG